MDDICQIKGKTRWSPQNKKGTKERAKHNGSNSESKVLRNQQADHSSTKSLNGFPFASLVHKKVLRTKNRRNSDLKPLSFICYHTVLRCLHVFFVQAEVCGQKFPRQISSANHKHVWSDWSHRVTAVFTLPFLLKTATLSDKQLLLSCC